MFKIEIFYDFGDGQGSVQYDDFIDLDVLEDLIQDPDSSMVQADCWDGDELVWRCKRGRGVLLDNL